MRGKIMFMAIKSLILGKNISRNLEKKEGGETKEKITDSIMLKHT